MNDTPCNRREFLGTSAAATGLAVAGLAATARAAGANGRLSVAIVGHGQRGTGLVDFFLQAARDHNAELTAVCDIWSRNRERGVDHIQRATGRAPRVFRNLEDLLSGTASTPSSWPPQTMRTPST